MLSVSVVPSVSVERAMECEMMFFDAVSLSGTMRSAMSVLLEETAADFLEHVTAARPRSVIHGSKVPAILRDWQELDAEQAALRARSTKRNLRERGLETTVVETQLCHATLCSQASL